MSKTTLTVDDVTYISWARHIRENHHAARRLDGRKTCADCEQPWGPFGCADYLWATDYLSQYSLIVIPDRPPRPKHRHRPAYITKLHEATADIASRFQEHQLLTNGPQAT